MLQWKLTLILITIFTLGCASHPPLRTTDNVDLNRYTGRWYEITSIPVFAQKGCSCTTATYGKKENGDISVYNRCLKDGEVSDIEGYAEVVPDSSSAKLKVVFFWPFKGDYQIMKLDDNYKVAMVGNQSRKYLWLLSRTPTLPQATIDAYLSEAKNQGYEIQQMQKTNHESCDYGQS